MAHVSVDNQHAAAFDGEADGNVRCDEAFSTSGVEGGESNDGAFPLFVGGNEFEVCAQHSESLVHQVAFSGFHDDFVLQRDIF